MIVQTNVLSGGGDGKIPQSHISCSCMEVCMGFHRKVALKPESVKQGFSEPPGAYKMFM